ncbi:---NA---, partial [Paramuricea clavata]
HGFLQRYRRDLNHECYSECCNWEEVREHYEHDIPAAKKYRRKFLKWKNKNGCTSSWSW